MSNDPLCLPDVKAAVRVIAMPRDTNGNGDIFGGWLMSQVDLAGTIPAYRLAKNKVVTVAVNEFLFLKPVAVGDLVCCYTEVLKTGRTSVRVKVDVFVERLEDHDTVYHKVAQSELTYVAVDASGNAIALPEAQQNQ